MEEEVASTPFHGDPPNYPMYTVAGSCPCPKEAPNLGNYDVVGYRKYLERLVKTNRTNESID